MMPHYPRAMDASRPHPLDPIMVEVRRRFFTTAWKNFLLLQLLFLGLFCWIFASLFQQTTHTHNFNVGFVDYDGGAIGSAFRTAYAGLQGDAFLTIVEKSSDEFATPEQLEDAVCRTQFWATLYISAGSSDRLRDVLSGASPANDYDTANVVTYIWNEANYPTIVDASISAGLTMLSSAAKEAYASQDTTRGTLNVSNAAVLPILVNPWQLSQINIQPTPQGSRAIYNTIVIVLILIQEFFYLGTLNGIYGQLKIWTKGRPVIIILFRLANSLGFTLAGSLCTTGAIWAFRSGWDVDGGQFAMCWMALWLFAHLNFSALDAVTVWFPTPYVPMALISWVIINVTSALMPFELSPAFFKLGYVLPAHSIYQVLVDIWSRGCNPVLPWALPVLFAWELIAGGLSGLGVYRRCHYATLAEEREEAQLKERVAAAVEFERRRDKEAHDKACRDDPARADAGGTPLGDEDKTAPSWSAAQDSEDATVREELTTAISRVDSQVRRERLRRRASAPMDCAFDLPFNGSNSGNDDGF